MSTRPKTLNKPITVSDLKIFKHNLVPGLVLSRQFESNVCESRGGNAPFEFDYPLPLSQDHIPLSREWTDIGTDIVKKHLEYQKSLRKYREKVSCNKSKHIFHI